MAISGFMAISQKENEELLQNFLNLLRATDLNNIIPNIKKFEVQFARMYVKNFVTYGIYEMALKPIANDKFSKELTELDLLKIEKIFAEAELFNYNIRQSFADFCKVIGKPDQTYEQPKKRQSF